MKFDSFVLDSAGIVFFKQPFFRFCGHCQISSIIQYYKQPIHTFTEIKTSRIAHKSGFIHPNSFSDIAKKHNLQSIQTTLSGKEQNKLATIQSLLKNNNAPVILLIAHLFTLDQSNVPVRKDSLRRKIAFQHYISIWGYDDETKEFIVYDSSGNGGLSRILYSKVLYCLSSAGLGLLNNKLIQMYL